MVRIEKWYPSRPRFFYIHDNIVEFRDIDEFNKGMPVLNSIGAMVASGGLNDPYVAIHIEQKEAARTTLVRSGLLDTSEAP